MLAAEEERATTSSADRAHWLWVTREKPPRRARQACLPHTKPSFLGASAQATASTHHHVGDPHTYLACGGLVLWHLDAKFPSCASRFFNAQRDDTGPCDGFPVTRASSNEMLCFPAVAIFKRVPVVATALCCAHSTRQERRRAASVNMLSVPIVAAARRLQGNAALLALWSWSCSCTGLFGTC